MAGMFERYGSTLCPAGMISSVDTLSETFSNTGSSSRRAADRAPAENDVRALDERERSSPRHGQRATSMSVLNGSFGPALRRSGYGISLLRGSVMTPVSADTAAVSGEQR